jgi:hypothetical protein
MSEENQTTATPPALPPATLDYATPQVNSDSKPSAAQVVFDTVTGPNLRVKDNLIQLAVIAIGTVLGGSVGLVIWRDIGAALGCTLAGMVLSLLLSGAIIGIVRLVFALKGRK